ncbi:MAG: sulfite exporter TauE/SafE family protein [Candidatus Omnitrophica bacterium]|nr:sulfite exporter TauE/SafE family protein [Candidatus Omnitrophota bacterium]
MTLRIVWSLFLTGLILGYGPCLLSCGPLLLSYISATQNGPGQGLKIYFVFSLTRIVVYGVFGILAGLLGDWVVRNFFDSSWFKWVFVAFGFFLVVLGLLLLVQKMPVGRSCPPWARKHLEGGVRDAIVFSIIVSLSPCLPLFAVLGYVTLTSDSWFKGLLYMSAFGLGTAVSPMVLFCAAAGWLAKFSRRFEFWFLVLRVLCCGILIFMGINLMRIF